MGKRIFCPLEPEPEPLEKKYQEPDLEPLGKKSGAGAAKTLAGSPALVPGNGKLKTRNGAGGGAI